MNEEEKQDRINKRAYYRKHGASILLILLRGKWKKFRYDLLRRNKWGTAWWLTVKAFRNAEKPVLNVGCGNTRYGDWNIDIEHTGFEDQICDAEHLPFKDKQYKTAIAAHCLEHCENPKAALLELHRVAEKVIFIQPHWLWGWMSPHHKWVYFRDGRAGRYFAEKVSSPNRVWCEGWWLRIRK
jgi:SAM-dependent methyltransferase